ncbi:helix-turn-helix domain-containing protein [Gemmiger formicilis]|uniref:helix-turn-helix domain-containing protein n=3 Tax=Gemmiger TaxID=204475 RepID=UPI001956E23A|nr:helix-turn-helix domain-containing protein [Gemmiger formicilis]MBM6914178.1 helix-turn-helix domain-containing protein [Gemmiger formicilis]HIX32476.1 helix-turn-helix domain-containing protein [Candidatus Gemmiger avium]
MNILVVDDEIYARKALIKQVTELLGSRPCELYEAQDAETARLLLSRIPFDLVLTDICMPGQTGLDLVEYMVSNQMAAQAVLVSGYAEFDYAKRAMELGVREYLLKPIEQEKLRRIVTDAVNRSEQARDENLTQNLKRLVRGDTTAELPFAAAAYRLVLLQASKDITPSLYRSICTECRGKGLRLAYAVDPLNATRIILLLDDEQSPLDFLGTRLANLHLIAGASLPFQDASGAAEAFRQAQSAIGGCIANAFCRLFVYQEPRKLMFTENELALFSEYLEKNTARARTYKEKLLERLVLDGSEYWNIDFLYGKLATAIQMCAYSHTGRLVTMRSLGSFESVYEIDLYLNERIEELNQPDQKDGCSMQDVVDYLNENYFDFISLDALAREKYFMNPRYFGKLFKDYTGCTFSQYLTQIRMEHARDYLAKENYTVSQVAYMCGYNSVSYFIQTFKKVYGETPKQFEKTDFCDI